MCISRSCKVFATQGALLEGIFYHATHVPAMTTHQRYQDGSPCLGRPSVLTTDKAAWHCLNPEYVVTPSGNVVNLAFRNNGAIPTERDTSVPFLDSDFCKHLLHI